MRITLLISASLLVARWSVAHQMRLELPTELHFPRRNNVCLPPCVLSLRDLLRHQPTSPRRLLPPSTPVHLPSHLPTFCPHLRVFLRSRSRSTSMLVCLPLTQLLMGLSLRVMTCLLAQHKRGFLCATCHYRNGYSPISDIQMNERAKPGTVPL
jgi:hypothetical protein